MLKKIAVMIVLVLLISSCMREIKKESDHKYRGLLRLGVSFLAEGQNKYALKNFLKAEKLNNQDPELYNSMGLAYLGISQFKLAEKSLQKAVMLKPDFSEAHNNLGVVYLQEGFFDLALEEFNKALSNVLYRTPEQALLNKGWAYYKLGKYIDAENYTKMAIRYNPRMCIARKNLGLIYWSQKRLMDAVTQLKKSIASCPKYAEAHFNLGLLYIKIKDNKNAGLEFKKVLELVPNTPLADEAEKYFGLLSNGR